MQEDIPFSYDWIYVFGQKKDCAKTADTPPRDRRRVKVLCVENECFALFIIAIVLSVGYQYIAVISKKAHRTHILVCRRLGRQPTKKERRATIAERSPTDCREVVVFWQW